MKKALFALLFLTGCDDIYISQSTLEVLRVRGHAACAPYKGLKGVSIIENIRGHGVISGEAKFYCNNNVTVTIIFKENVN